MIRIGVYGYGNLGKGVETVIENFPDMKLFAIFTERNPEEIPRKNATVPLLSAKNTEKWEDLIDVMLICKGSASDLPSVTPKLAKSFSVIDSFDRHAKTKEHFFIVDRNAREAGKLALISCGWDPGIFSLARLFFDSVLPNGAGDCFWGRGVSQGHSDAVRRIPGVKDAREYTLPNPEALECVKSGKVCHLPVTKKHFRECFVAAQEGADKERIEKEIKSMPDYFLGYPTSVFFISEEELRAEHSRLFHGGTVLRTGWTGEGGNLHRQQAELRLSLDSNPEFTASVMLCYARALARMRKNGESGCRTVFDIPFSYLTPLSAEAFPEGYL